MTEFRKIIVNGKEIDPSQIPQLPDAVREVLADKNNNGIPDALEGLFDNPLVQKAMQKAGFQSFDQLPLEMREKLQGLMNKLGGGMAGAASTVQVQNVSTGSMGAGMSAGMSAGSSLPDWKQSYSLEEPKSISVKTVIFATAMIFAIALAVAIAFFAYMHR